MRQKPPARVRTGADLVAVPVAGELGDDARVVVEQRERAPRRRAVRSQAVVVDDDDRRGRRPGRARARGTRPARARARPSAPPVARRRCRARSPGRRARGRPCSPGGSSPASSTPAARAQALDQLVAGEQPAARVGGHGRRVVARDAVGQQVLDRVARDAAQVGAVAVGLQVGAGARAQLVGEVGVERQQRAVAGRDRVDRLRRRLLALDEQVVVAERGEPRRAHAGGEERLAARGAAGRAAAARRGRAGRRSRRGCVAACTPRSRRRRCRGRPRRPGTTSRNWSSSLACALSTRSPVSSTASGRWVFIARIAALSTCGLSASCGRNAVVTGGPSRSRNGTRAGDSSSRTWVSVSWPKPRDLARGARRAARARCGRRAARPARARAPRRRPRRRPSRSSVEPGDVRVAVVDPARRRRARATRAAPRATGTRACGTSAHACSRRPATTGSRTMRAATQATAIAPRAARPTAVRSRWPACGGERQAGVARGERADERAEHEPLDRDAEQRGGDEHDRAGAGEHARRASARPAPVVRSSAIVGRRSRTVSTSAWASTARQTSATVSATTRRTVASTPRNARSRVVAAAACDGRAPSAVEPAADRGAVGAVLEPDRDLRVAERAERLERLGGDVRRAALVLQRADDAADAQAQLAAGRQRDRERRARAAARARRPAPAPTSTSPGPRRAAPSASGGASKPASAARERDEPQRLAERVRGRRLDRPARRGAGDAVERARPRRPPPRSRFAVSAYALPTVPGSSRSAVSSDASASSSTSVALAAAEHRDRRRPPRPPRRRQPRPERRRSRRAPPRRAAARASRRDVPAELAARAAARRPGPRSRATPARPTPRRRARRSRPTRASSHHSRPTPGADLVERERAGARSARASTSAPIARPSAAAGAATSAAPRATAERRSRRRGNPTARWTPIAGSRRATSLRAVAPSITPAVAERDDAERDEQRDDDPGGLADEHLHAGAGDEAQVLEAERHRARLGERDVLAAAVVAATRARR